MKNSDLCTEAITKALELARIDKVSAVLFDEAQIYQFSDLIE